MAARDSRHGRQYEEDETMFRPVRKKANEISVEEAKKLLREFRRGVRGLLVIVRIVQVDRLTYPVV